MNEAATNGTGLRGARERSSANHRIELRVYYEDTDFSGIVYHANHLKFFERGRTDALRACGVTHTDLLSRDEPLVFAVRRMDTQWHVPARIDDRLEVYSWFEDARGARMMLYQEIFRPADGALIASADVEAACLSLDGRPRRIPNDVRNALKLSGPF